MKRFLKNIFPGFYGLLNYFTIRLLQDTESGYAFWRRPALTTALEVVASIMIGYIIILSVNRLCRYTDSKQTPGRLNPKSLTVELLLVVGISLLVSNLILVPFTALTDDGMSVNDFFTVNTLPLLYTVIYYGIVRSQAYFKAYVANQLLVEKLTNDHLQTELKFLRAQYHPHFLFNALNTIYFQVDDDVAGAKQSIELLSELLRYQLYDRQHEVSIKQELDYLQNYILLQKVRASKKMVLNVVFDEELTEQQIYPLLFLPLVENAFKYVGGKYRIDITAESTADGVLFTVKNDLPEHIQPNPESSGIGIENLNRRLELLYPNRHKLTLDKQPDCFIAGLELKYP
jgi:two-component system LytT family sensor kinase